MKKFPLALSFCLIVSSIYGDEPPKFGKISEAEWAVTSVAEYPDANAVILFDRGDLEVTPDGISFSRHVRIKVFNDAGAEEAGDITFGYWEEDKIKDIKAHTITPDGKKFEVSGKDIKEQKSGEYRSRTFSFPQVLPGAILEYTYRNYNTRFRSIDPWYFHNNLYTMTSQFSLMLSPGFVYSTAYNNIPPMNQQSQDDYDIRTHVKTFTWKMANLPPLKDEPYQGAQINYRSALHCQMVRYEDEWSKVDFISNWPDLGKFFADKIIEPFVRSGKGLNELSQKLSAGLGSTEDMAIAIYHYVRDSIRTVPVADNYFPREKIELLLTERIGTSDEKNLLVVELCKRAGMKAWPGLICTRDHGVFNNQIYQLRQLNQLIAIVETDKGSVLLDATSRYCPYGVMSPKCLVKGGLLIDGDNSRPITINPMPPQSYRVDRTLVTLDESGLVHCSTHAILNGYLTVEYGEKYETIEPEKFVKNILMAGLNEDFELVSHQVKVQPDEQKMEAFIVYTSPKLAETMDGNLFLDQPVLKFGTNPFVSEKRFFPIDFTFPALYQSIISYAIDTSFTVSDLPEEKHLQSSKLEYQRLSFINGDQVIVESKLLISEPLIVPELYTGVRRMFSEMELANREQVVFVPKN